MRSSVTKARHIFHATGNYEMARKVKFAARPKILKDLEGKYQINGYWGDDVDLLRLATDLMWTDGIPSKYTKTGQRLSQALKIYAKKLDPNSLGRVLYGEITEDRIAKFIEMLGERELVFSCKANHIARMSHSRNFRSCMSLQAGTKKVQVALEIGNPDIAVVFIVDKRGDFQARALVRLLVAPNGVSCLGVQKVYGDGTLTVQAIIKALSPRILTYELLVSSWTHRPEEKLNLTSYSKFYNPLYKHLPWVDVTHSVITSGDGVKYVFVGHNINGVRPTPFDHVL